MKDKGQKIVFADLLESQFNGNYGDMVDWLNKYNRLKEVIYITQHGRFFDGGNKPYIVDMYIVSYIKNLVHVNMTLGGHGDAKGLIFINNDFVGKEDSNGDDIGIKWYVNGRLIDDKEF